MARRGKAGRTLSLGPPEGQPWAWMTTAMLGSFTYRALGIHARRILDFLMHEHASHAGRENGNLGATYEQLEAWGVTAADVRKGFAELYATGFVVQTQQGYRRAGGGEPSRYALTWLPTLVGTPSEQAPSHGWVRVIERLCEGETATIADTRRWLGNEVGDTKRGVRKQKLASHLQVVSPITCEASEAA